MLPEVTVEEEIEYVSFNIKGDTMKSTDKTIYDILQLCYNNQVRFEYQPSTDAISVYDIVDDEEITFSKTFYIDVEYVDGYNLNSLYSDIEIYLIDKDNLFS